MRKKILYFNLVGIDDVEYEKTLLDSGDDYDVSIVNNVPDSDLGKYAADADAVAIDYTLMTDELMSSLSNCKVIVVRGVGSDNLNPPLATKYGICACNAAAYCSEEVAVHAIGLALSLSRYLPVLNERTHNCNPDYSDIKMYRPQGRVFGFLSFGNVPKMMVRPLKALDFRIVALDPYVDASVYEEYGVEKIENLDELLQMSDFLSVHSPLIPQTKNLLNKEKLALMKPSAFLIVTSRGGIVDEEALRESMLRGHIKGAGLDAISDEIGWTSPLQGVSNVIITPHVAYFSEDSNLALKDSVFTTMYQALKTGKLPKTLLNKDVIGQSRLEKYVP